MCVVYTCYVKSGSGNAKRCAHRQADGQRDGLGERLKEVCGVEGDFSCAGEGLLNTS